MSLINISIDVKKLSKDKLKIHANGATYCGLVVEQLKVADKFGNTHTVYESQTKEQREAKEKRNYVGNGKEFVFNKQQPLPGKWEQPQGNETTKTDDLPF